MNLRPLSDHIIVKPLPEEEVSVSGIILPDTVDKERPERGEVVQIGPGKMLENGQMSQMNVEIGQKVVFKKYAPDEVKVKDEKYLVIRMEDIIAVIEE
jgi:chaperonin GroES